MKVAVVGATGMVGQVLLKVLEERNFPLSELLVAASSKSIGKTVIFNNKELTIISVKDAVRERPDLAIFSAGGNVSLKWAPHFTKVGAKVIDNSSAWRLTKALIIPEINGNTLNKEDKIIANPKIP